ncbi:SNF5-domain-containing protein [Exidia glandulosa HHB12029]|uniref:SNF5-domain-containing protein n=1 Tax=Exidia glandulosa HHB12029 TaxID=1314781 RepID=A0A165HPL5_EXIGL|nr:SNF5-domain-containing protein [Exidia glandulosa HHB12029]
MASNPVGAMSDAQLKQHISMLTQARGVGTPTGSPATYQSTFALPFQPANATWAPTPTRPAGRGRGRGGKPQTPAQVSSPYPSLPVPPPPPRPPIPTQLQALHTSYASRMRTGASLLVQPVIGPQTGATAFPGVTGGGRSRRVVNYAEAGSGDDFDGGEGSSSDESDQEQPVRRRPGRPRKDEQQAAATPAAPPPPAKAELDQSYLGQVPPAKFITSTFAKPTKHEYYPQEDVDREARKPAVLVPIRVELDTETLRVRDAFTWNLNEELITPQQFARAFCADLDIPPQPHVEQVAGAIRAQLDEHAPIAAMDLRGALITAEGTIDYYAEGPGEDVPDCRVILSIDVQIDSRHLVDHIEWDLLSPLSPEEFAKSLCADIGLHGEAVPLVAHAVHEELLKHKRDALEWGLLDDAAGAYVRNMGLGGSGWGKQGGAPRRLKSVWREWNEIEEYGFCPRLEILSQEEVERREIERERASRRLRRETSRFQNTGLGRRRR